MKTIILTACASALMLMSFSLNHTQSLGKQKSATVVKTASIKWIKEEISMGEIPQGQPKTVEFEFKNTGELPVLISTVQASCGCTTPEYSKTPILPGETGKIKATYNAAAKGVFKKTVTVTTSAEEAPRVLSISGTVI
jgi:hypothetical protein